MNELSERLGISKNTLIQVSHRLSKLGFIETTRGRGGGLLIREKTGQVTLREIIRHTEESFAVAECFSNKSCSCTFLKTCLLKDSLATALEAFLASLGRKTLDDVTPGRRSRPAH